MPFCTQCGTEVRLMDTYCAKCGGRQPGAPVPSSDYLAGISGRTASLLCYIPVLGWLAAIVILASTRFRLDWRVRFNAFQGLYLFVAWLLADWVVAPLFSLTTFPHTPLHGVFGVLLKAVIFAAWIFMIVKVSQDETYKLPILGDLAERSVSEQK